MNQAGSRFFPYSYGKKTQGTPTRVILANYITLLLSYNEKHVVSVHSIK